MTLNKRLNLKLKRTKSSALCKIDAPLNEGFQGAVDPICLILLDDTVREDAPEILRFLLTKELNSKLFQATTPQR